MQPTFNDFVITHDGSITVRHPDYDEEFHSVHGARQEANSLYMEASGFRERMNEPESTEALGVLDVGLGLGYNALMSLECWMRGRGDTHLNLVSLEKSLELVIALADPGCGWKKGWSEDWQAWSLVLRPEPSSLRWRAQLQHPTSGKILNWIVIIGNALEADLSLCTFDYIWQDAFSHKKNPELWSVKWFEKLRACSHPKVQMVTYSVARLVRDHMEAAGWVPLRMNTPAPQDGLIIGKKRWLKARLSELPELSTT